MTELRNLIHTDIATNPDVINIELGAGCGDFGAQFYPDCFLTDIMSITELKKQCKTCSVTISCDAHSIPSNSDRFMMIIICNPYGYGFNNPKQSTELLDELYRVSKDGAEVLILTTLNNKYSAPQRIETRVKDYNNQNNSSRFTYNYVPIICATKYPGYTFYTKEDASKQTFPNHQISLKCHKP